MLRALLPLLLLFLVSLSSPALAERRVALVIGNSAYENVPVLANPKNDSADMSTLLRELGFEVVTGTDLDFSAMRRTIREFVNRLPGADLALFYYAGHGLQVRGENYLAPTDAELARYDDLDFEAIPMEMVVAAMERHTDVNLIFLDACRDNPLATNLARSMGTRSSDVGAGLARIGSGLGTLISFATQPGNVALDGDGRNSPFTGALLKHIGTPNEDIMRSMIRVRRDVLKVTNGQQVPWENSSLTGEVILNITAETVNVTTQVSTDDATRADVTYWESIEDSRNAAYFEAYLKQYPEGIYAGLARLKLGELRLPASSGNTKTVPEGDAAKAPASAAPKPEGLVVRPREPEVAATASDATVASPDLRPDTAPKEPVPNGPQRSLALDQDTRRAVQMALAQMGHDPGPVDGQFGPRTRSAIRKARESLGLPVGDAVDSALLAKLPDVETIARLNSSDARRISPADLPEGIDPRLIEAVKALQGYELKFGFHDGRVYLAVLTWGKDWEESRRLAERAGGHLVTISHAAENRFVHDLFAEDGRFLSPTPDGQKHGPWIGLYQRKDGREPNGGWAWVTGEDVTYRNWSRGQPNNFGGNEGGSLFHTYGSLRPREEQRPIRWDDYVLKSGVRGFVMEIE